MLKKIAKISCILFHPVPDKYVDNKLRCGVKSGVFFAYCPAGGVLALRQRGFGLGGPPLTHPAPRIAPAAAEHTLSVFSCNRTSVRTHESRPLKYSTFSRNIFPSSGVNTTDADHAVASGPGSLQAAPPPTPK